MGRPFCRVKSHDHFWMRTYTTHHPTLFLSVEYVRQVTFIGFLLLSWSWRGPSSWIWKTSPCLRCLVSGTRLVCPSLFTWLEVNCALGLMMMTSCLTNSSAYHWRKLWDWEDDGVGVRAEWCEGLYRCEEGGAAKGGVCYVCSIHIDPDVFFRLSLISIKSHRDLKLITSLPTLAYVTLFFSSTYSQILTVGMNVYIVQSGVWSSHRRIPQTRKQTPRSGEQFRDNMGWTVSWLPGGKGMG